MSNIKKIFFIIILLFLFQNCENRTNNNNSYNTENQFSNIQKQAINESLQNLDKNDLILKLNSSDNIESLLALSILHDSSTIPYFVDFLNSKDQDLKSMAAFAIGQINDSYYSSRLVNSLKNKVLGEKAEIQIIIALGKIGGIKELEKIVNLDFKPQQIYLLEAQAKAFFLFSKRGIISKQMLDKTFDIITQENTTTSVKKAFSYWLTQNIEYNLNDYFKIIEKEIDSTDDDLYAFNLFLALTHTNSNQSFDFLKQATKSEKIKIKYAAIKALETFPYQKVKPIMWNFLTSENEDLSVTAAKYFVTYGIEKDANEYLNISKRIKYWQPRAYMLMAALNYTKNKKKTANLIISGYNASENLYEKAALLKALSADPTQYKFVMNQSFNTNDKIISTACIKSVLAMRLNPNFDKIAKQLKETEGIDLYTEFKVYFKEVMQKGDNAMIYYATLAWENPDFKLIDVFTNTFFINQAFSFLVLPRDLIVYKLLCQFPELKENTNCANNLKIEKFKFDWDEIKKIPANQQVIVKTTKGNIKIRLDVNSAPATVYTFLTLAKEGYYNNVYFYKKVPCKFISTGGRRGDGWQDKNIPLVKEALDKNFQSGSIAMNIIDDIYQSVNWFITITPTPEYDGKYTIFGKVIEGLDVVEKIQPGDKILKIKIL